ncbi:MAG TPA: universal stress protein [Gaiellaceae bacterium]|nr:universal stress protein [Gaiellaceae bacterium]
MRRPDLRTFHRRARRFARWTGSIAYRSIVVPLLDREETEHALDLACRLAADRGARVVLVGALVVERELPLNAHMDGRLGDLERRLESAAAVAASYGVAVRREIVRVRPGSLGEDVARVAAERRAELVVVGAPVESRRGFHRAFPREVLLLLRDAPCRVMIATGPVAGTGAGATAARTTVPPWHDGAARPSSSSAYSARTRSSPPRTATSARRSTTPSASSRSSRSA